LKGIITAALSGLFSTMNPIRGIERTVIHQVDEFERLASRLKNPIRGIERTVIPLNHLLKTLVEPNKGN